MVMRRGVLAQPVGSGALPGPAGTVYQTMDGFGSSERLFDDPHVHNNFNSTTQRSATTLTVAQQDAVLDALYIELGLTRVRPVQPEPRTAGGEIEIANDNSDPAVTDLTQFDFTWKKLDGHANFIGRARSRGVTQSFYSPLDRETWMGITTANDAAEYGEWLFAQTKRSINQGGDVSHISVANEPSYTRNNMSGTFIRDVIKNVGPRLAAIGRSDVKFVIPDDVRSSNGALKATTILADATARSYVGALATHLYDEVVSNLATPPTPPGLTSLAATYSLPLWMTEFSLAGMASASLGTTAFDWALLMHDLMATYNVTAVDHLWAFFGDWDSGRASLINLNSGGGTTYLGFTRNKVFYYTGQWSQYVKPGALRVGVTRGNGSVEATMFFDGATRVIVAINPTGSSISTTLSSPDLAGVLTMPSYRTSSTENWATTATPSVTSNSISVTLPASSVTTFVGTLGA